MVEVNRLTVTQTSPGRYVTEISSLEVPPGRKWPEFIDLVEGDTRTTFHRSQDAIIHGGEFAGWNYRDTAGRTLTVFND